MQTFCVNYLFPEGNFGSLKKTPEGNLGFLERDYLLPKEEMTLDKVLRSPHGKLNTPLHFDSHTFSGNCKHEFFANNFSKMRRQLHLILTSKCDLNFLFHPPVNSVKQLESFDSTWLWQIKEFLGDHMLILSNIRGH